MSHLLLQVLIKLKEKKENTNQSYATMIALVTENILAISKLQVLELNCCMDAARLFTRITWDQKSCLM